MGKSGYALALFAVLAASTASAQQPQQWVRLSLNDGRFVDGYITGGDAASHFVQTSNGYFSVQRMNVVAITPIGGAALPPPPAAPMPGPPPAHGAYYPPPAAMPAPAQPHETPAGSSPSLGRAAGVIYFGAAYGVTVLAASAKVDNDKSARAGYIPVFGPVLWAFGDDEDNAGEDGWDWLAVGGSLIQGAGLYWIVTGGPKQSSSNRVSVTPVTSSGYGGVVVGGRF